ncbi:MAG: hypothetical protein KIT84_40440 [Labilithrix sp.]|nr:hypothetical protein [Labilithrix sp.]MCW5817337.1 hypothetical protein [Labilithrix sp.]
MNRFTVFVSILFGAMATACGGADVARDPSALGSLANVQSVVVAAELGPRVCKLESIPGAAAPDGAAAWSALDPTEWSGETLTVLDARATADPGNVTRALQLRDARGATRWVRNPPVATPAEAERAWSCVVDANVAGRAVRPITATKLRLVPGAATCGSLQPAIGDAGDVTFEPYAVVGRRLARTETGIGPVTVVASADGASVIALSQRDLDACFAATQRPAIDAEEREHLGAWLAAGAGGAAPTTPLATYLRIAGLDERDCLAEGVGPTRHDECRAAAFGAAKGKSDRPSEIRLFRERIADAVHAYGGIVAPAADLAGVNVVVKDVTTRDAALASAFPKALQASMADSSEVRRRAERGYRIFRPSDVGPGSVPGATLELEVSYPMPKVETFTQERTQRRLRGKVDVPNPAYEDAARRVESARASVASADREAGLLRALFKTPRPRCDAAPTAFACDGAVPSRIGESRSNARRARLTKAESVVPAIAPTIAQDDVATVDYRAKVFRRRGEASVTLKLTPTDALAGIPGFRVTRKVPFSVSEIDVVADPARGVEGRSGKPPIDAHVAAAVARAVFAELTGILDVWMMRSTATIDPNAFERGSKAQLALVARHAAANRRVRLVSDLIENRPAVLARGKLEYPITINGAPGGCHTVVAMALEPGHDVDLSIRARATRELIGRDARAAADAALDLCPLASGAYVLEVSFKGGGSVPVAIALFDSTSGVAADVDYGSAMPARMDPTAP